MCVCVVCVCVCLRVNVRLYLRGCFNFWRINCMLSGHVQTLGHNELTQFCQYTGDKLIMILLLAIHSPKVETSSHKVSLLELPVSSECDQRSTHT